LKIGYGTKYMRELMGRGTAKRTGKGRKQQRKGKNDLADGLLTTQ